MRFSTVLLAAILGVSAPAVIPNIAYAAPPNCDDPNSTHPKCGGGGDDGGDDGGFKWMHGDVSAAHAVGDKGAGSYMIILDSHNTGPTYSGNLDGTTKILTHGGWTSLEAQLVAPAAGINNLDHPPSNTGSISSYYDLTAAGINVVNLSFGWVDTAGKQDVDAVLGNF